MLKDKPSGNSSDNIIAEHFLLKTAVYRRRSQKCDLKHLVSTVTKHVTNPVNLWGGAFHIISCLK